eukprot:TRINITY_DN36000_c0_g2_i1.p1 TRINITY_DN36000_c0_g2~~TRINITY_DN36000_c0_g2_i1.p1  ORF type:complete len:851 (+),score=159.92 TRINITY_DN36000_c0_g2_i1:105-2555(+)
MASREQQTDVAMVAERAERATQTATDKSQQATQTVTDKAEQATQTERTTEKSTDVKDHDRLREELLRGLMQDSCRRAERLLQNERQSLHELHEVIDALSATMVHARQLGLVSRSDTQAVETQRMTLALQKIAEQKELDEGSQHIQQQRVASRTDDILPERAVRQDDMLNSVLEDEHKLNAFVEVCKSAWKENKDSALDTLTRYLTFSQCGENLNERLAELHRIWEEVCSKVPAEGSKSFKSILLHSKIYSMEGGDVDALVGAVPGSHHPAPYRVMNAAARLLSQAQTSNNQFPKNVDEAQDALNMWIKIIMTLSSAAVPLDSETVRASLHDLRHLSNTEQALASLCGDVSVPEWMQTEEFKTLQGPCLFCGLNVPESTFETYRSKKQKDLICFCDLRSATLCSAVAKSFLNSGSNAFRMLVVFEGVEKGLPVWLTSEYPQEFEIVIASCSKFTVASDPRFILGGVLLLHLRYIGCGLDEPFLDLVRGHEVLDDYVLRRMSWLKKEKADNEAAHLAARDALRGEWQGEQERLRSQDATIERLDKEVAELKEELKQKLSPRMIPAPPEDKEVGELEKVIHSQREEIKDLEKEVEYLRLSQRLQQEIAQEEFAAMRPNKGDQSPVNKNEQSPNSSSSSSRPQSTNRNRYSTAEMQKVMVRSRRYRQVLNALEEKNKMRMGESLRGERQGEVQLRTEEVLRRPQKRRPDENKQGMQSERQKVETELGGMSGPRGSAQGVLARTGSVALNRQSFAEQPDSERRSTSKTSSTSPLPDSTPTSPTSPSSLPSLMSPTPSGRFSMDTVSMPRLSRLANHFPTSP